MRTQFPGTQRSLVARDGMHDALQAHQDPREAWLIAQKWPSTAPVQPHPPGKEPRDFLPPTVAEIAAVYRCVENAAPLHARRQMSPCACKVRNSTLAANARGCQHMKRASHRGYPCQSGLIMRQELCLNCGLVPTATLFSCTPQSG